LRIGKIDSDAANATLRFFDASALVKRYVAEPGGRRIDALLRGGLAAADRLSEAGVASALARRYREGAFPIAERDRALAELRRDLVALFVVELSAKIVARAATLPGALSAAGGRRAAACLLEFKERLKVPCVFVCSDERLLAAARRESLATAL
jgi:predicted nucleic acid-binding protein